MKLPLKLLRVNRFFVGSCFLITAFHVNAQATVNYDSIQDNGTRNDTLTFVEDFADAKYALNSLFVSNDSLSLQMEVIIHQHVFKKSAK